MRISYRSKDELLLRFLLTKQFSLYESIIFNVSELNDRCVSYFTAAMLVSILAGRNMASPYKAL